MSDIVRTLLAVAGKTPDGESEMINVSRLRDAVAEIQQLRTALVTYGDRARMSNVADMAMQQAIDRAFENTTRSTTTV